MKPQVFLLVAAIVLAGCVGQPGGGVVGGTAGVIITSFSPEVPEVDSGSGVIFLAGVKNVGDKQATNVEIAISGLDDWQTKPTGPALFSLGPADPTRGLEGEERLEDLTGTAPSKDVGVTYTPTARVTYHYETKSTIQLKFATSEQIRGTPAESTAKVTTTGGPFVITVRGKLPTVSSRSPTATFQLEIQNVGGGRAGGGSAGTDRTAASVDFIKVTAPTGCTAPSDGGKGVRLIGGKSRLISCKITPSIQPAGFATATLDITLVYEYFVETQTSVTVLKTPTA